jgi:hypothetical protein
MTKPRGTPTKDGGRAPTYDWPALRLKLEGHVRDHGRFPLKARLIEWCQKNAAIGKEPDEKTVREAIKRHGLNEIGVTARPRKAATHFSSIPKDKT